MPESGEPRINPEPAKGPEVTPERDKTLEREEKGGGLPPALQEVVTSGEDPFERSRKEVTQGAIKTLEQKSGRALEFSSEQWSLIQKYTGERAALLLADRAEQYLQIHKDEARARGMDPDAKGAAAVQAIEELGAVKEIVAGDRELENVYIAMTGLKEFSRSEIPPSARFAILEQINQLPDDTEELKRLRIDVFQRWSGRDPATWSEADIKIKVDALLNGIFSERLSGLIAGLSPQDKEIASKLGLTEQRMALMKELEYQFSVVKPWFGDQIVKIKRGGIEIDPLSVAVSGISGLRVEWERKVREEIQPGLVEKAKRELGSSFAKDVTGLSNEQIKKTYDGLKNDILAEFDRKRIAAQKEGQKTIETSGEALEEKGRSIKGFMRDMAEGWEDLSGDKTKMLTYLKDNYDMDISEGTMGEFEKASGLDYNMFSKKRRSLIFYALRLMGSAFREAKKIRV